MREILFRGKRLDDEGWEYGGYACTESKRVHIIYNQTHSINLEGHTVYPDTVGQYTGLTDKNGKKIFEGDIVKFPYGTKSMNGKIEYIEEDCIYYLTYKTGRVPFGVFFDGFELEIIGNIHDNPELLEVTE